MIDIIRKELDDYRKAAGEKINFLQQLRNSVIKTEAEINMLNGAIQACEKLLESDVTSDGRKTK